MSPRARMFVGFVAANAIVVLVAFLVVSQRQAQTPPLIQGVLLPEARPLQEFQLLDHRNQAFRNRDLEGSWHIVSYGFTTCPDICPTTLSQLVTLRRELQQQGHEDFRVLFYTVDHRRDTVTQMASYVPYFDPAFIGLTHVDDSSNPHLPFENSLGIVARLVPLTGPEYDPADNEYQVNHGVTLFLLNPEGKLQAIFEPDNPAPGQHSFNPDTLLRDYLAIRQYLG